MKNAPTLRRIAQEWFELQQAGYPSEPEREVLFMVLWEAFPGALAQDLWEKIRQVQSMVPEYLLWAWADLFPEDD
jgi:hypothetical protein